MTHHLCAQFTKARLGWRAWGVLCRHLRFPVIRVGRFNFEPRLTLSSTEGSDPSFREHLQAASRVCELKEPWMRLEKCQRGRNICLETCVPSSWTQNSDKTLVLFHNFSEKETIQEIQQLREAERSRVRAACYLRWEPPVGRLCRCFTRKNVVLADPCLFSAVHLREYTAFEGGPDGGRCRRKWTHRTQGIQVTRFDSDTRSMA